MPSSPEPAGRADESKESDGPDTEHRIPEGVDSATVEALGKLSEALELTEDARGSLYNFHRKTGAADLALGEAVEMLIAAGHGEIAAQLERDLVGRNVIEHRWTFQIIEDYDDGYYAKFRSLENRARQELAGGRRHLHEARMKEERRTPGLRHHEPHP